MISSESLFILTTLYACHKCAGQTPVVAIAAPAGAAIEGDGLEDVSNEEVLGLSNIADLGYEAIDAVKSTGCRYFVDESFTAGEKYWMNHCTHCGAKIGDHYLYGKPGIGFSLMSDEEYAKVDVKWLRLPLRADADLLSGAAARIVEARHRAVN